MAAFLHTRWAFFAVVAALSLAAAVRQLVARDDAWSSVEWWQVAIAAALGAALAGGVYLARRRGQAALPGAGTLWAMLALALVWNTTCNLFAFPVVSFLPLPVFLTMGSMCLLWAVGRRVSLLFWGPFLALEMAQMAGYFEYGSRINSLVLAETFEASGAEALAYLSSGNIGICVAVVALGGVYCWLLARLMRGQKALPLANAAMLWGLLGMVYSAAPPPYLLQAAHYWPVYEVRELYDACTEAIHHNQATISQVESLPSPALEPSSLETLRGDEGVVVVVHIGESVRADRMSINGYERDTTPWLRSQESLINFPNCISAACDTCQAQIAILTDARRDIYESNPAMLPRVGSVLDLFAANRFRVYSFFGRRCAAQLKYDRVVRLLTSCAEERFHAPGSPWTSVPQMAELLRRIPPTQNLLFFINNEGSHTPFDNYDFKNPPFSPALCTFHNPAAHAQEVNNAYDATVHYTDEFVHRVTRLLQGRPWIYIYVSDHGEYLGHDGIWGRAGLGESKRRYHSTTGCRVGMFVLASPELQELHPHIAEALQQLSAHAASGMFVAHEHIFHTLLGLFDLRTPWYNAALDLASPHVQPYEGPRPEEPPAAALAQP